MMDEEKKKISEKIENWLKEEGFFSEKIMNNKAYFNFVAKISGMGLNVLQSIDKPDSILVATNLTLSVEQLDMINKMDAENSREFFWDLRLALLNADIGDFSIKPHPPNDVREVFISSNPIYYDGLSKDRLISTIFRVCRSLMLVIWMLERASGAPTPRKNEQLSYIQ